MTLTWRVRRRNSPWGPLHICHLGSTPVASIEDRDEKDPKKDANFLIHIALPSKRVDTWGVPVLIGGYQSYYFRFDHAKRAVERLVRKWVSETGLR